MVLDVTLLHESRTVDDDPGPTQVIELVGKKQKAFDVNKEFADDVAEKAVSKIMQRMQAENDRRDENLFSRPQVSLKSAAEDAVGRLSGELFHNLKSWEAKMDDKMPTHLNNHRLDFEKKWENKIAQLDRRMVSSRWQNFAFVQRCKNRGRLRHSVSEMNKENTYEPPDQNFFTRLRCRKCCSCQVLYSKNSFTAIAEREIAQSVPKKLRYIGLVITQSSNRLSRRRPSISHTNIILVVADRFRCEQHTSHVTFCRTMTRTCVAQASSRKFGVRTSHSMCHLHALMLCI